MRSASIRLAVPLLTASTVLAQFVSPPEDLTEKEGYAGVKVRYKEVPTGICELDPNVKSYSGYADVSEDQHIFWWFFEARNNPKEAPLTVWINGGPGSSSMIGLFQELGPCGVGPDLKPFNNPYSWTNVSNMLFIDQPTMVGFSYSTPVPAYTDSGTIIQLPNNTCPEYAKSSGSCGTYSKVDHTRTANDTANGAPNMWSTLQGFMGAFPEYSSNGFHFATESYGGHYAPIYNAYILDQNEKDIPGAHAIDLQSVLIGNGWFDPVVQFPAYYDYAIDNSYDNNLFNDSVLEEWHNNLYGEGNCLDQTLQCAETGWNSICQAADNFCYEKVEYMWDIYSGRSEYDMREIDPDPFPYGYFSDYLQTAEVQKAVGAFTNFSFSSSTVSTTFANTGDDARESGTYAAMKQILDAGVQLMLYFGDSDYICNWIGGEVVADNLNATGFSEAGYVNITTSDGIVHGQVKQADLFSFVRIYEAGHEVPFYQPLASLEVFDRAIKYLDVATGKEDINEGHITEGTPTSDYREGNGTVQYEVTPANATYNTMLNAPDPEPTWVVESPPSKLKRRQLGKMEHPKRLSRTRGLSGGHRRAHRGL